MTTTPHATRAMTNELYRGVLGGPQSDKLLHGDTLKHFGDWIPGNRILDTGIGRGGFTKRVAKRGPQRLLCTDFDPAALETVKPKLGDPKAEVPATTEIEFRRLDLTNGVVETLAGERFGLEFCLSVLMHLDEDASARAIELLADHVEPGGTLVVGVIDPGVARKLYIPAPSKGKDWFYPRLKGLSQGATESDIPLEARVLAERYSPHAHYERACNLPGFTTRRIDLIAGEECRDCLYREVIGAPLWNLHVLTRNAA